MKAETLFAGIVIFGLLQACSSSPVRTANMAPEEATYVEQTDQSIHDWQSKISQLKNEEAKADMSASLQDAQAQLRDLQNTQRTDWTASRDRIDSDLDHVRAAYQQQMAE